MRSAGLRRSIQQHTASVAVIGQGYVGLTVGCAPAAAGMEVVGIDRDSERINALAQGRNVVPGVPDDLFLPGVYSRLLTFATGDSGLADADVVLICVPTPVIEGRPDLRPVESAAQAAAERLRRGQLVVLESTTYPGTTDQVVRPLLEASGLRCGRDFLLAYSPERIDPGNGKYGLRNTPRIVGGCTAQATELAALFYRQLIDDVVTVSSCRAAELTKLLENTYRMVNIALVNELAMLCADQSIDVWEVVAAAATKPFGFMPFYPGPGVGGHCIPLDPAYLAWQSRRDTGKPFRLVETAADINAQMPTYVAQRVVETLNDRGIATRGADLLVLGVTYKPDVGDVRESAALQVMEILARRGSRINYHDPFVTSLEVSGRRLRCTNLSRRRLAAADAVLLLTPHSSYDLDEIIETSAVLFDARNAAGVRNKTGVVTL